MATKVNVKWGKNSYDVEVDPSTDLDTFQASLFSLTAVPIDRQKLMYKGKFLKSTADITGLPADAKLQLIGTADTAAPLPPPKPIVFEEDLTEAQKAKLVPTASAGLVNLGNTCYMNSTLQCFRAIPELKDSLISYSKKGNSSITGNASDPQSLVTGQLGSVMQQLDSSGSSVTPMMFTTIFRQTFPQFAERNNEGQWAQQDADECLQQLMQTMASKLETQYASNVNGTTTTTSSSSGKSNVIDSVFSGDLSVVTRCTESSEEPPRSTTESFRKLRCSINDKINFLHQGIALDLETDMEMRSSVLGRNAIWKKKAAISRLPRYLIVQFVRFFWKRDVNKKAKILRKVEFPLRLDVSDFCAPQLARSILAARRTLKAEEDVKLGLTALKQPSSKKMEAIKAAAEKQKEKEREREREKEAKSANDSTSSSTSAPMEIEDLSSTPYSPVETSGYYELVAVVSHKGRSADGGHYIGWTKQKTLPATSVTATSVDSDKWWKYDDDVVSEVDADKIKSLCGGGDEHMAYLIMYRRIDDFVGKTIEQPNATATAATTEKKAETTNTNTNTNSNTTLPVTTEKKESE